MSIDPELKDAWGIPALHISMTQGDNEKAMMEDARIRGSRDARSRGREEYSRPFERLPSLEWLFTN